MTAATLAAVKYFDISTVAAVDLDVIIKSGEHTLPLGMYVSDGRLRVHREAVKRSSGFAYRIDVCGIVGK